MQITVIAVGKLKRGPESELCERYRTRFDGSAPGLGLKKLRLLELTESRLPTAEARKSAEADAIASKIPNAGRVIACDEHGSDISSPQLADEVTRLRDDGLKDLSIVIGGPDGLNRDMLTTCTGQPLIATWSFGRITLPHGLARITLVEQLYRATTLMAGHPYHRT